MTAGTRFYRAAARFVAPILHAPGVRSIYIRRSVAGGDADFPWSDLDLGLVVEKFRGREMMALRHRFLAARLAFPRLGQCQIASAAELNALALSDPYRASLDRRCAITVAGDPPSIPLIPVSRRSAARRLVFWFERYLPLAVRQRNLRNQRKIVLEMWNALGVMEGKWAEPLPTRCETAARACEISWIGSPEPGGDPFAVACVLATRALQQLLPSAPVLPETVILEGQTPLVLLPVESAPWQINARNSAAIVVTPAVLQLLLETHSPFLWLSHGPALENLGFTPPSRQSWAEACLRLTGGERLRIPGFMERDLYPPLTTLSLVERVLEILESGDLPEGLVNIPAPESYLSIAAYYRDRFDNLSETAAQQRHRAAQILAAV